MTNPSTLPKHVQQFIDSVPSVGETLEKEFVEAASKAFIQAIHNTGTGFAELASLDVPEGGKDIRLDLENPPLPC